MLRDQALKILQSGAGSQFDPQAVGAFLELLPELEALLQSMEEETAEALTTPPFLSAPVVDGSVEGPEVASVWEELERRLEERPALATFLPCLAELAPAAIPFSTLALLTEQGAARGNVAPTFTSGLWTSLVDGMEVALGEGVSGWVAHTGEPVRNAPASMDLGRRVRPGENLELNSTLSVPVTVGGRRAGALTLYHQSYNFYQAYHQERLVRLAGYVAQVLALEASRPVEEGQAERALPAEVSSAARLCPERIAGEGERSGERAAVALLPRVTPAHSELAANGASTNGCPRA